jgi:hypothetical protein
VIHGRQTSVGKTVDYEAFRAIQALLLADKGKYRVATQDQILPDRREQRKWRRLPSQSAVKKDGAAIAHRSG